MQYLKLKLYCPIKSDIPRALAFLYWHVQICVTKFSMFEEEWKILLRMCSKSVYFVM